MNLELLVGFFEPDGRRLERLYMLRGDSKRPTRDTLDAIAGYLGATVSELLGEEPAGSISHPPKASELVMHPDILSESLKATLKVAQNEKITLTIHQAFHIAEDAYHYALRKTEPCVDTDFIQWLLEKVREGC